MVPSGRDASVKGSGEIEYSLSMRAGGPYHGLHWEGEERLKEKSIIPMSRVSLGRGLGKGIVAIAILSMGANRRKQRLFLTAIQGRVSLYGGHLCFSSPH